MKFEFFNPTHLIFGAGTLSRIGNVASRHGNKALIVTGGGAIRWRPVEPDWSRSGKLGDSAAGIARDYGSHSGGHRIGNEHGRRHQQ